MTDFTPSLAVPVSLAMPIRSERLELRLFEPDDIDDRYAYQRLPEVARYLFRPPHSRERCAELIAEGGSQPDRLVAKGNVRLAQGDQKARCDRLDYDRRRERLVCRGNAWFQDGENRLSGEIIEVDLRDEKVTVTGGATVLIRPEPKVEEGEAS